MPGRRVSEALRKEQILGAAYAVAVREGLDGLTMRAVASEAGVSAGLVFFHFTSRDALLIALLDWLLALTTIDLGTEARAAPDAGTRLAALARQELEKHATNRAGFELFFEFWVRGLRQPEIRQRIRTALERYRAAFLPYAVAAVAEQPERFGGLRPEDLALAAVSLVEGGALQAVSDPEQLDSRGYAAALQTLLASANTCETS